MKLLPTTRGGRSRFAVLLGVFSLLFIVQIGIPAIGWMRYEPLEGDLIFQSLPRNPLVDTIEGSTGSPYSHCGILTRKDGRWVVLEAIGPVRETPLFSWIRRGRGSFFEVYRLKPEFQPTVPAMVARAREFLGLPYDINYELDDEKIYCSELIWKACRHAGGGDLGVLVKLGQLNWRPYERVIRQIEGSLPLEREMITPRALAEAGQVDLVLSFRAAAARK
jgi:hypothetical protein